MSKIENKLTRDEEIDKQLYDINYMFTSFTQGLMSKTELDEFIKLCLDTMWGKGFRAGLDRSEEIFRPL